MPQRWRSTFHRPVSISQGAEGFPRLPQRHAETARRSVKVPRRARTRSNTEPSR
jgi:hypothetical protein